MLESSNAGRKTLWVTSLLAAIGTGWSIWNRSRRVATTQEERAAPNQAAPLLRSDSKDGTAQLEIANATERYLLCVIVPLWVLAGFLDYLWHRRTEIETTSGTLESVIHGLMMTEAGLPMLFGLTLNINAGVLLLMIAGFFAHSATAYWDVSYAVGRRKVTPGEQHVHSLLEVLPFCAVSFVICLHWNQFASLFGFGGGKASFQLRRKQPPLRAGYLAALLGAVAINSAAYVEEFARCYLAQVQGLTGTETPTAAAELYAAD